MQYQITSIAESQISRAPAPVYQHLIDTYASETNKTASVWRAFAAPDMNWRPHARSSSVVEIMKHQLLSERRFFAEFLGSAEPAAAEVLPAEQSAEAFTTRLVQLAVARLPWLASQTEADWQRTTRFFDVKRERIWVFWRRVLHSAHHRTQLTVYLRLLNKTVPATYGPSADVTWSGADPTLTVEAAERGG